MYSWGNYDQELYRYYKNSENRADLKEELEQVFATAQEKDEKVAPGLFAEYGYLLLEEGASDVAAEYFAMEREAWPESEALMDKMIAVCEGEEKAGTASSTEAAESKDIS